MKRSGLFLVVLFVVSAAINYPRACFAQLPAITAGVDFLHTSQNLDGSWGSASAPAPQITATAAVVQTIAELTGNTPAGQAGAEWLAAQPLTATDNLSRRILAGAPLAADPQALLANLDGMRKAWGGAAGYDVNNLDSALALSALRKLNSNSGSTIGYALNFLLSQQNPDGGWGFGDGAESELYYTSLADLTLQQFADLYALSNPIAGGHSYLLANQNGDGGFGYPASTASETALTCLALLNGHLDSPELDLARQYLTNTQLPDGSWGDDPFETALALLALARYDSALLPLSPSAVVGKVADSITGQPLAGVALSISDSNASTTSTLADGTFTFGELSGGTYSLQFTLPDYQPLSKTITLAGGTILDLGQLAMNKIIVPVTAIKGTITDAGTGLPVVGASIILSGATTTSAMTDGAGGYLIEGLNPGVTQILVSKVEYAGLSATALVAANQTIIFSPALSLQEVTPPEGGSNSSALTGALLDSATGLPLPGAAVSLTLSGGAISTTGTDPNGIFAFADLPSGSAQITLTATGYPPYTLELNLPPGMGVDLGNILLIKSPAPSAAIKGKVTVAGTGLPLGGAAINVSGSTVAGALTDSAGEYLIDGLNPGGIVVVVSKEGYNSLSVSGTVALNQKIVFSPGLSLLGETPPEPGVNTAGLTGIAVDDGTAEPLANVNVALTINGVVQTTISDENGSFSFADLESGLAQVSFSKTGYLTLPLNIELQQLMVLDLGRLAMSPEGSPSLLSDLLVESIDMSTALNDPQTLAMTGSIGVTVKNGGTASAQPFIGVIAYHDLDHNAVYDSGTDILLGQVYTSTIPLAPGGVENVQLPLHGKLPFRDAPITVWVDSLQNETEGNEGNNQWSSASICRQAPDIGTFAPVLKWAWTGSAVIPTHNQVVSAPIVVPVEDTNGDGLINQNDIPGIVFHTYAETNYLRDGVLRAVSGVDGHELWNVTNPAYRTNGSGSLAAGDIDGDGLVEIIAPKDGSGVIVFENDGSYKWQSNYPYMVYQLGGAALADIDHDGSPEIIVGNTVLNADGTVKWAGSSYSGSNNGVGTLSIVADINLDGNLEVVAGGAAYSNTGQLLWQNTTAGGGFPAVANFNDDDFLEVVVVTEGRVTLLDHFGKTIWYSPIPGAGLGGAPTIADMDGDGWPEIGVTGVSKYVVYRRDGSILWTSTITDSSSLTGSSVFDFDGDGSAEIVYADEYYLRVLKGIDGSLVFATPNTSGTALELPVIADVDNDNHADIVVCTNQFLQFLGRDPWPATTGIRVFQDINNSWVNTRKIWNQHSYHITNVNDDGTIPQYEQPSWLSHNSYRLNTFADRDPLDTPDLSAGMLRVVDNGHGVFDLTVRIGNGGTLAVSQDISVSFYEGDPGAGGRLLGVVKLAGLAVNSFTDVNLAGVTGLTGVASIYAMVASDALSPECNQTNNSIQVAAPPLYADLTVSGLQITDNGAGVPVSLAFTVANPGAIASPEPTLIAFYSGSPLGGGALLATMTTGALLPGAAQQLTYDGLNGNDLGAELYVVVDADDQGHEYSECNNLTSLTVPQSNSGVLTVGTDRPGYGNDQPVQIQAQITNTGSLPGEFTVRFQIEDTQGVVVATLPTVVADRISGGATAPISATWNTANLLAGTYLVRADLDSASLQAIHTATSTLVIGQDDTTVPALGLRTSTDQISYLPGETVKIANMITNQTTNAIIDNTRLRLSISEANGANVFTSELSPGQLLPGMQKDLNTIFALGSLPAGQYTLLGEVVDAVDAHLLASDQAVFTVAATATTGAGLTGTLALADQVYMGRPVTASYTISNNGNEDVDNLAVRILIIDPQTDTLLLTVEETISVARQAGYTGSVSVDTAQLGPGLYMAVLTVATPAMAKAKTLGSGNFAVLPSLEVETVTADPVNLLVWINDGCAREDDTADDDSDDEHHTDQRSDGGNSKGLASATAASAKEKKAGDDQDEDPAEDDARADEATKECVQVGLLESILTTAADSHTLVHSREDFERALRSPYFTDIMILGDHSPLTDHADLELRELTNAGTGLISGLWSENTSAGQIFGLKVNGSLAKGCKTLRSVTTIAGPVTTDGVLAVAGRLLKVEATDQQAVAGWLSDSGCAEEDDQEGRDDRNGQDDHSDHDDHDAIYPAIVLGEYGLGRSVFFTFNIGAELRADNLAQLGGILTGAIANVHLPRTSETYRPYQLVPTRINLRSLGGAFDLRVTETYSPELHLFDPLLGAWLVDNPLITETALAVDGQKDLSNYVLLPDQAGLFSIATEIGFIFGGEYSFFDSRLKTFALQRSAQGLLQEIIAEIKALGGTKAEKSQLKNIVKLLEGLEIGAEVDGHGIEKNITDIVQATSGLLELDRAEAGPLRLKLDELLRIEQSRWYFTLPPADCGQHCE